MATTQFTDVDLSLLKLAPPTNKSSPGFKSSSIQYKGGKLNIQTPVMKLPWDVKPKQMDEGSNVSAQLALSFVGIDNEDEKCELNKFMSFMRAFDVRIKELVTAMDGGLGKKSEAKVLDANFKESIREATSGNYPPTIQPKIWLRCREGGSSKCVEDHEMDIAVYNMEQQMISPSNLAKGSMAAAIIEPNTAWCSTMGVGVTWVARQVVVKPLAKDSFAFKLDEKYEVLREEGSPKKRPRLESDDNSVQEEENEGEDIEDDF